MTNSINPFAYPNQPTSTVVPESWNLFIPYFNRVYEDIAFNVNAKDNSFFAIPVTNTPTNIPNIAQFGSFLVAVSGEASGLPTITASLTKADSGVAGVIAVIGQQVGSVAPWVGATLTITSTATNFQINHSVAATSGKFNIRIIGTQNSST